MVSIGSNIAGLKLQRALASAAASLSRGYERLSSGSRLNRPSDDAAGLAIASSLRANTRVYSQAIRNLNDGGSMLSISQGAVSDLKGIVVRMRELSEQSANGIYSPTQRRALNGELGSLINEYNRVIGSTRFNGLRILDRSSFSSIGLQAGYDSLQVSLNGSLARTGGTIGFDNGRFGGGTDGEGPSAVGDFNGDGLMDVARVQFGSRVSINFMQKHPDGIQLDPIDSLPNTFFNLTKIYSGDFNGDGRVDLIVGAEEGQVMTYLGNGDGSFQDPVLTGLGSNLVDLTIGDFNGDGVLDFAALLEGERIDQFNGTGTGGFNFRTSINVAAGVGVIRAQDLNGDGRSDLVSLNQSNSTIQVRLSANGLIQDSVHHQAIQEFTPTSIAFGDLNNDGIIDIIAGNDANKSPSIRLGTGGGQFANATNVGAVNDGNSNFVKLADFDQDGHLDLLHYSDASYVFVRKGRGDGTFDPSVTAQAAAPFVGGAADDAVHLADFNGDGIIDIMLLEDSGQGVTVFEQGTFDTSTIQHFNISTQESARNALDITARLLDKLNRELADIGSYQSRLQVAISNLYSQQLGESAAEDRISSADIAEESAALLRAVILQQTSALIAAQANLQPELAVRLLRG